MCSLRVTDEQFDWDTVASQFGGIFEDVLKQETPAVEEAPTPEKKKRKKREKRVVGAV